VNLTKILAGAAISGALGFSALGLGAGVANANPPAPVIAGVPWWGEPGPSANEPGSACFIGPFWHAYCL